MKEFNIGDRVWSKQYNKSGVIEDKLYSNKFDDWMYTVQFDDSGVPFIKPLLGYDLELFTENKSYRWEVFQADNNVVTAVMYEVCGDSEKEIARHHGHIMHEGVVGVAQAASYAMKKVYIGMNGGKYIGLEDDGYVR